MIATTWILTEESPQPDTSVRLLLVRTSGAHPRVRYILEGGRLRAGVVTGSADAVMAGGEEVLADIDASEDLAVLAPSARSVPDMPGAQGGEALARLQRGADVVWESTTTSVEVRGLLDLAVGGDSALVLPLLRHSARRIVVTEDDRLLVLDEHASQPRTGEGLSGDVAEAAVQLFGRPAVVDSSRIRVHDRDAVRCAYVDGSWHVVATSGEGRLQLSLPLDFPAERFGDA